MDGNHEIADLDFWKHQNEVAVRIALGADIPNDRK